MENLFLLLANSLVRRLPSTRKLKNQVIGSTGCTALMQQGAGYMHTTDDGDHLFLQEFEDSSMSYGLICIQLNEQYSLDAAAQILSAYLDRLRESFRIEHRTGAQVADDWNTDRSHSVVDYWQDRAQADWKVKGYTNGQVLSVLYVKNIGRGSAAQHDHFLDSFHFGAA